jgi:hypothetical protein
MKFKLYILWKIDFELCKYKQSNLDEVQALHTVEIEFELVSIDK